MGDDSHFMPGETYTANCGQWRTKQEQKYPDFFERGEVREVSPSRNAISPQHGQSAAKKRAPVLTGTRLIFW